jgi:hypothetical protein
LNSFPCTLFLQYHEQQLRCLADLKVVQHLVCSQTQQVLQPAALFEQANKSIPLDRLPVLEKLEAIGCLKVLLSIVTPTIIQELKSNTHNRMTFFLVVCL